MRTRSLPRPSCESPAAPNLRTPPDLPRGRVHGAVIQRIVRVDRLRLGQFDVPLSTSKELIKSDDFRLLEIAPKKFEATNFIWDGSALFTRQLRERPDDDEAPWTQDESPGSQHGAVITLVLDVISEITRSQVNCLLYLDNPTRQLVRRPPGP